MRRLLSPHARASRRGSSGRCSGALLAAAVTGVVTTLSAIAPALAGTPPDGTARAPEGTASTPGPPLGNLGTDARRVPLDEVEALLGWAAHLSGYSDHVGPPEVRLEPDAFFVANACLGDSGCRVLGWYADRGVVHLHERFADLSSLFARSLLVHELVHYLQHASGRFAGGACESFVAREREAYAVQQAFFVAYGAPPGVRSHHFGCVEPRDGRDGVAARVRRTVTSPRP